MCEPMFPPRALTQLTSIRLHAVAHVDQSLLLQATPGQLAYPIASQGTKILLPQLLCKKMVSVGEHVRLDMHVHLNITYTQ